MTERTCEFPGCGKRHAARGYCRSHYRQLVIPDRPRDRRAAVTCTECGTEAMKTNDARVDLTRCNPCSARRVALLTSARAARKREERPPTPPRPPVPLKARACQQCGAQYTSKRRAYCTAECAHEAAMEAYGCRDRQCRDCGTSLGRVSLKSLCAECLQASTRASRRAYRAWRRALERGARVEKFSPRDIYDRDGWMCGICERPVDRDALYPDPQCASLDHVVPLSRGGEHSRANAQCSHLACNMAKSDTMPTTARRLLSLP